jgi:hypothetical protein
MELVTTFACLLGIASCVGCAHSPRITNLDEVLGAPRLVLIGEIHGTQEEPAAFAQIVRQANAKDVLVGFEQILPANSAHLDAYLHATRASLDERIALLSLRKDAHDGSTSIAITDLFESLRKLAQHRSVHAFGFYGRGDSPGYAEEVAKVVAAHPGALVFAYMGATHAQKKRAADDDVDPVGQILRGRGLEVTTIYLTTDGGTSYNRGLEGAGLHALEEEPQQRAQPFVARPDPTGAYDFTIYVGRAHASMPARGL